MKDQNEVLQHEHDILTHLVEHYLINKDVYYNVLELHQTFPDFADQMINRLEYLDDKYPHLIQPKN